ncbi:MAG TPA: YgjP-like metallopeptidase domain-containing protein [Nitrososphaerales archaeon]|nr:YgjP-like metallopeptidase domain-containing protein [Nitrososphaerales archaeon]
MPAFELGGKRIEYEIVHGTSRRYTYFRFRPDLTLEIVVPRGRMGDPRSAISQRAGWILEKYDEIQNSRRVLDGRKVMFDGKFLDLVYEDALEKEEIVPDFEHETVLVRASERSRVTELVRRWFLKETSRYVMKKLGELSPTLPVAYKMADVREIRNWGYCTRSRRLSFSWQLIALPERLRDYIIFHELTHLEHFNHSRAFKRRLAEFCPGYRERERELNLVSPAELSYF